MIKDMILLTEDCYDFGHLYTANRRTKRESYKCRTEEKVDVSQSKAALEVLR